MRSRTQPFAALSARGQFGFTLVELSVALVIALFLMGGLLTMVQSTRTTYGNQNELAQLQDNQRAAMTIMTDVIQSAAYFPDPVANTAANALPANGAFQNAMQGVFGQYSAAQPNDTLSVQYMTANGDGILLCDGQSNNTGGDLIYINTFAVDLANSQLTCSVNGAAPIPIVNGVTNLQVLYGIKTTGTDDYTVDTYARADQLAMADWPNVSAVKIRITFKNPLSGQPGQPATIDFERVVGIMSRAGVKS